MRQKTSKKSRGQAASTSSGQVFLLSLMLLAAVSVMGVILITVFTQDLKLAYESSESTKALYAADSEMERLLYWELVKEGRPGEQPALTMSNGTSFEGDWRHFSFSPTPSNPTPYLATVGYNNSTSTKSTVARGMKINFQISL